MKNEDEGIWLTPEQLHKTYGLTFARQARLRSDRKIPFSKIKHLIRYNKKKINDWLKNADQPLNNTPKDKK